MYILSDPLVCKEWSSSWRSIKENFIFAEEKVLKFFNYHYRWLKNGFVNGHY